MTTETTHAPQAPVEAHGEPHGLTNAGYVRIAVILALITALEVSTYYVDFGPFFLPSLIIMMFVKFVMVVSYFMHLRFDHGLFSFLFSSGLVLAVGVYVAFLATLHFFLR